MISAYIFMESLAALITGLCLIALVIYIIIRIKYNEAFHIKAETIRIGVPFIAAEYGGKTGRLIAGETYLRKLAYKNTTITTDASFFDNSDMQTDYYLVVVYDKRSGTPLLSARYYFDKTLIAKALQGDVPGETNPALGILNTLSDGEVFLSDRLSGNISSALYRRHRDHIFMRFYTEVLTRNKRAHLILMARRDPQEKLLTKYIRRGFHIIGLTEHKGKEHWIILADLKKTHARIKHSVLTDSFLLLKYAFSKNTA